MPTKIIPGLPQSLRLGKKAGEIPDLPGFIAGHWTVQDASAQWVAPILDTQPGEEIFDVCAAPGGKTTHIAELMGDRGIIFAGDRTEWRLQKLQQAQQRLGLHSIKTWCGDLTAGDTPPALQVDRALLDVPCSGLGTLHRNPDLRWRQSPHKIAGLIEKQAQLIQAIAPLVKPGGILVYATCTLNPAENTAQVEKFLAAHPQWHPQTFQWIPPQTGADDCTQAQLTLWPHLTQQDGFFIAKLIKH